MSGNFSASDAHWMRHALELARHGHGLTHPNPRVGAVLVRGGKKWGEGFHLKAGGPHAEVAAVRTAKAAGARLAGSTLYVTLEPCSTHGRTPPCTDLILRHGIARVVVGAIDPNPAHAGEGLRLLRAGGVDVAHGLLAREAEALNPDFNHWVTTGLPFVTAKIAMSIDGRIQPSARDSRWLTSAPALRRAHELRWAADAIMVGAETARTDNPRLTVRLPAWENAGKKTQPWRIIFARGSRLPRTLALLSDRHRKRTLLFRHRSFRDVMENLGARGITHVLLEGGGHLLAAAFAAKLVNRVAFFTAPCVLGGGSLAVAPWPEISRARISLEPTVQEQLGPDFYSEARVLFS